MANWDLWSDVRTVALRDVLGQRSDYVLRRIFRWYSKTFTTPLHEVEDLPLEYVLQHYFETMWEKLEPHEIAEEKRKILLTPREEFDEMLAKDAEALQEEEGESKSLEEVQKVLLGLQPQQAQAPGPGSPLPLPPGPPLPPQPKPLDPLWNPELTTGAKPPLPLPNINMSFEDLSPAEFEAALEEDAANLPSEPPKKTRVR